MCGVKRLLLVWHSQFGGTAQMAAAARDAAVAIDGIEVIYREAQAAGVEDLLECDALLVATSENFGSLSGMTKDFFERVFYPCEHAVGGKPYTVLVCAGSDGAGAMRDVDRIARGLRLSKVLPGLVFKSGMTARRQSVPATVLAQCAEIAATLAAGVAEGIF